MTVLSRHVSVARTVFFGMLLFVISAHAETQKAISSSPSTPATQSPAPPDAFPLNILSNIFIEGYVGYAALPKRLVQMGDSSVTQFPNLYGYTRGGGLGLKLTPRMRIMFEYERESVNGGGAFGENQGPNSPEPSVGANGSVMLGTGSRKGAFEGDLVHKRRFDIFAGAAGGRTQVFHSFNGVTNPIAIPNPATGAMMLMTFPAVDRGKDRLWDPAFRVGARYRIDEDFEMSAGVYGNDSVNGKISLIWLPGDFIARIKHRR